MIVMSAAADSGHDLPLLPGLVPDAAHRRAALHRVQLSIAVFYLASQRELFPKTWMKTFLYLPFLMALGIGLTVTNTKAVMEALFGIKSAFARTPKYRVAKKGEKSQAAKYRKRLVLAPWIELLLGCLLLPRHPLHLLEPQLLHRAVPDPVRHRLLVHRPHEPAARPLRALAHRHRQPDESSPKPFPVGV